MTPTKQIIKGAIDSLPREAINMNEVPLTQRALLMGKHPFDLLSGMIEKLPDAFDPYIIKLAKAIVHAAGD